MAEKFSYPSCGAGQICGLYWKPEGEIKAVVQIVHGIAEHVARYDGFATFLAAHGILVVAEDHMGHGSSIGDGPRGYFTGGWHAAAEDTYRLLQMTRQALPEVPYVLLGHSMGSFLARTVLAAHPDCGITAAVISGTAWMSGAVLTAGRAAARLVCSRQDERQPNAALHAMMFGSYNRRVEHRRTPSDWLTRDNAVVDAYEADPLCGFPESAGLARDMMEGLRYIQQPSHLRAMRAELPVLFIAGGDDPVGSYGAGVRRAAQEFEKAGMDHVTTRIYPLCRHEVLNELNRDEIWGDVLSWITAQCGGKDTSDT